jgi:hypothetical protein
MAAWVGLRVRRRVQPLRTRSVRADGSGHVPANRGPRVRCRGSGLRRIRLYVQPESRRAARRDSTARSNGNPPRGHAALVTAPVVPATSIRVRERSRGRASWPTSRQCGTPARSRLTTGLPSRSSSR